MLRDVALWLAWPINMTLWVALCFGAALILAGFLVAGAGSSNLPRCYEDEHVVLTDVGLRCIPKDGYGP
jgi:hypothetical protein